MSSLSIALSFRRREAVRLAALLAMYVLLSGCGLWLSRAGPKITFTRVPAADVGGPDIMATLAVRVTGARSGERIVLYAKSEGRWWMQPPVEPSNNSTPVTEWKGQAHPGTEYGALLVDAGFVPPASAEPLPGVGGPIAAFATVAVETSEAASAPPKVLHFSGYDWKVRSAPSHRAGTRNVFDPANVWVDDGGALHLKIARAGDHWTCSEVQLTRSLGYGTYLFVVRDISHMDLSAVLTLFTWDGGGPEENRRELAYEVSRWGNPDDKTNTAFVIQPYYIPTNVVRFRAPPGEITDSFRWEPAQATFASYAGAHYGGAEGHLLQQHVFNAGIPAAGGEAARINLYVFGKGQVTLQHENEVVIEKFEYYP